MYAGSRSPWSCCSHSAHSSRPARACANPLMHALYGIGFLLALGLLVYLGYALLRAERF
jgi:K+-transporting ATPase KdpF subunit